MRSKINQTRAHIFVSAKGQQPAAASAGNRLLFTLGRILKKILGGNLFDNLF